MSMTSSSIDAVALVPGFADPVLEAQAAFRELLNAFSYVGRPVTLGGLDAARSPLPLGIAAAAAALTLIDVDTPVWLAPGCRTAAVTSFLRFHCGAPIVEAPVEARFAIAADASELPALTSFDLGSEAYPDRSATIILQVRDLEGGAAVTLTGPGIDGSIAINPAGLDSGFWESWRQVNRRFPIGIDLLLVSGSRAIGLPRTAKVEAA